MPPHFRPSPALLNWEKNALRWPGPFGFGFLSPQPPGIAGIGPNAARSGGQRQVGPFSFALSRGPFVSATRIAASADSAMCDSPAVRLPAHSGVKKDGS